MSFSALRSHVAAARRGAGLSQTGLADLADVDLEYVKNLETRRRAIVLPGDGRSPADWAQFARVCRALGEDPVGLLGRHGILAENVYLED